MKSKDGSLDVLTENLKNNSQSHWVKFIAVVSLSVFLFYLAFGYGVGVRGIVFFVVAVLLFIYAVALRLANWQAKKILDRLQKESQNGEG